LLFCTTGVIVLVVLLVTVDWCHACFYIKPTVATASAEVAVAATGQFVRKELDGRDKSITEKK